MNNEERDVIKELDCLPIDLIVRETELLVQSVQELQNKNSDRAVLLQQQIQANLLYLATINKNAMK